MKPTQDYGLTYGTSFHGVTIRTSINTLIKVLGDPICFDNTGEDKVNVEWNCISEECFTITIYDWKEYRILDQDEIVSFHIGGFSYYETQSAKNELQILINNI